MAHQLQPDIDALNQVQTSGEKHGVLNKIFDNLKQNKYTTSEIDAYLKSGWKQDRFNKMLYVDLADRTKANNIIINLLKSEDDQLIWYTIKKCSFMWADKKYNLQFYVTDIFPFISYANRLKLLKEIANNTNDGKRAEEFYNELSTSYGMPIARPFFVRCTSTFLMENIKLGFVLSSTELRRLLPQNPDFIVEYLSELTTSTLAGKNVIPSKGINLQSYKKLVRKILSRDYAKIFPGKKHVWQNTTLGRKLCKRLLISPLRKMFTEDSEFCRSVLPKSMIYKYFTKEEYNKFYRAFFPEKFPGFCSYIMEYLDYYKNKEDQLQLLLTTYKDVYGEELLDNLENVNQELMSLLDTRRRVEFAEKLMEKVKDDEYQVDGWICYLTCDMSVPQFKKKIYATSDGTKRQNYLCYMLKSCEINADMSALLEVLSYYNQRHRNELKEVTRRFVGAIPKNMTKFDGRHWQEIDKLIDIIALNKDFNYLSYSKSLLIGLIEYNLTNKLPAKKSVTNYIKWCSRSKWSTPEWTLFPENPNLQKQSLVKIGEIFPDLWPHIPERIISSFLSELSSWNKSNSNDCISVMNFPWLMEYLAKTLDNQKRFDVEKIYVSLQNDKSAFEFFGGKFEKLKVNLKHLKSTIETDKELVRQNMKEICEEILELKHPNRLFFPLLKTRQFKSVNGFEEYIKDYCLNIVNIEITEENPNKLKPAAMRVLLHWLQSEEFYSIAKLYYPTQNEAPLSGDAAVTTFNFQKVIAYGIKHFKDHPETFEAIKKFCIGDYLKLTTGTMKSVCSRISLKKADDFLDSLVNSPVSFKKHIIRLKFLLNNKSERTSFLQHLWITEKNRSIREIILNLTIDLFVTDPDSMVWNLIKNWIESALSDDFYIADVICKFDKIPKDYFSEYIQLCWTTLFKLESENSSVQAGKRSILQTIENNLTLVSPQIVENILKEHLFQIGLQNELFYPVSSLASKYILQNNGTDREQDCRIEFYISVIKEAFDSNWNTVYIDNRHNQENPSYPIRTTLNFLLDQFYTHVRYRDENLSDFVMKFLDKFDKMFDTTKYILTPYLRLKTISQFRILKMNNVEFGKYLRDLIDKYVQVNGALIVPSIAKITMYAVSGLHEFNYIEMSEALLAEPMQSSAYGLFVVHCVPFNILHKKSNKHILDKLSKINDVTVQMMLGNAYE